MFKSQLLITQNNLIRIGLLMGEMRRDLAFEVDERQLKLLEKEFRHIRKNIFLIWKDRLIGLNYFLEFHLAEVRRLHDSITADDLTSGKPGEAPGLSALKIRIYVIIKDKLGEMMRYLAMLLDGSGIKVKNQY